MNNSVVIIKKDKFKQHVESLLYKEPILKQLISELLQYGTAYIVGGFLRDFLNNEKSRDIDIIADLKNVSLTDIIKKIPCQYSINRHNGFKLQLHEITVDIWDIHDNWAFKNNIVKINPKDKLTSIAKGCFYNYDSLVINLSDYRYNIKYYNQYCHNNELDIIFKSSRYKTMNNTTEANIIRAFFIRFKHKRISFSNNLVNYIITDFSSKSDKQIDIYLCKKKEYPKYNEFQDEVFIEHLTNFIKSSNHSDALK